jgi:hypothetical protein
MRSSSWTLRRKSISISKWPSLEAANVFGLDYGCGPKMVRSDGRDGDGRGYEGNERSVEVAVEVGGLEVEVVESGRGGKVNDKRPRSRAAFTAKAREPRSRSVFH